jgi:hypothetical protein
MKKSVCENQSRVANQIKPAHQQRKTAKASSAAWRKISAC